MIHDSSWLLSSHISSIIIITLFLEPLVTQATNSHHKNRIMQDRMYHNKEEGELV